jgi:phosphoglycerate kinase
MELLGGTEVLLVDEPASDAPKALLAGLRPGQVILLENLRFDPGETKNSRELAGRWASYIDVYINDAFGASHRAHASIDALARLVSARGVGFLIKREIEALSSLIRQPEKPFLAILGGSKVSDKIAVIENLIDQVDAFMIGGAMAYTFLAARQTPVGRSRVEKEQLQFAKDMMNRIGARKKRLLLPVDHLVANAFEGAGSSANPVTETPGEGIGHEQMGLDIGPKSRVIFREEILRARTIFWNGPMGVFENEHLSHGTRSVAESLAQATERGSKTVIGGGDSAAAAEQLGFAEKIWHISTGGGASLEYIQGDELPGLEALRAQT